MFFSMQDETWYHMSREVLKDLRCQQAENSEILHQNKLFFLPRAVMKMSSRGKDKIKTIVNFGNATPKRPA